MISTQPDIDRWACDKQGLAKQAVDASELSCASSEPKNIVWVSEEHLPGVGTKEHLPSVRTKRCFSELTPMNLFLVIAAMNLFQTFAPKNISWVLTP